VTYDMNRVCFIIYPQAFLEIICPIRIAFRALKMSLAVELLHSFLFLEQAGFHENYIYSCDVC
jgi:hypothetical protein